MAITKGRVTLGATVTPGTMRQVDGDATRFDKTRDGITEAAFNAFFELGVKTRATYYRAIPDKRFGRPRARRWEPVGRRPRR